MMRIFSFIFFTVLLFSISCNRIELDYYSLQESQSNLDPISSLDSRGKKKSVLPDRSSQNEFQEKFISSKLDLVFILDTNKKTESFYSKNFLGDDFLSFFYDYNWRLAWTDMSVDIKSLKGETDKKSKSKCGFFSNLILTVGGALASSAELASFGLKGLFHCISHVDSKSKEKTSYANGSFLPFEDDKKIYYLTGSNPHSSTILNKSLTLPNPKNKAYKAPLLKESKSFPLLSMIFSISKNFYTQNSDRFFREDSLVVFVLFSLEDSQMSISAKSLKKSLHTTFGSYDRFKMILVTLKEDSPVFCPLYYENSNQALKKLPRLAKELNQPVLDICSQELGKEIFNEISKGLSRKNLL